MKRVVVRREDKILSLAIGDRNVKELNVYDADSDVTPFTIGAIYIGKIANIVKNLNAAFVNIGVTGENSEPAHCFLPLDDLNPTAAAPNYAPIFIKRNNPNTICPGDELLVQILREPIKTKLASLTTHLAFDGRYAVILPVSDALSISKKITDVAWKARMKGVLEPLTGGRVGIILRTNAYEADESEVEEEIRRLTALCRSTIEGAPYRTVFSCLYKPCPLWLSDLRDIRSRGDYPEIETDVADLYEQMKTSLVGDYHFPEDKLRLESENSLISIYNVERLLEDLLRKRVWLNSGAYLVIEPTEALTVIDVNTGKAINKKDMRSHIYAINREAATEAARQIRLRNLSGIILIDFINMPDREDKDELMKYLKSLLEEDPTQTTLVGISKLDLVEITRQKVRKPLHETFRRRSDES